VSVLLFAVVLAVLSSQEKATAVLSAVLQSAWLSEVVKVMLLALLEQQTQSPQPLLQQRPRMARRWTAWLTRPSSRESMPAERQ
jgi:hypothetical protein